MKIKTLLTQAAACQTENDAKVAKLAAEKAMEFHAQLIEELGVARPLALRVAKKSWKGA